MSKATRPALLAHLSIALYSALAAPLRAGDDVSPEIVAAMAGEWLLAREDGSPGCRVTLGTASVIGGYEIEVDAGCQKAVPQIAEAAAWRFGDGGLVLADATRKSLLTFAEQEDATYVAAGDGGARLHLAKAAGGVSAAPNAKELFGPWAMVRPEGERLCMISLSESAPPGGGESYALTIPGTCDPAVMKLKLASWRVEGLALMLYGMDGASLAFEPDGKGGFRKSAREGGRPLLLVRPRK